MSKVGSSCRRCGVWIASAFCNYCPYCGLPVQPGAVNEEKLDVPWTDEDKRWVKAMIAYAARVAVFQLLQDINLGMLDRMRYAEDRAEHVRKMIEVYEPGKTYIGPGI